MVDQQLNSQPEENASSVFNEIVTNLGFKDDRKRVLGKDDLCQVRTENGQASLYLPDGTKIPQQLDIVVDQPLSMALSSPRVAHVTIRVLATIADTAQTS